MTINNQPLTAPLLTAEEEVQLARTVEAGLYATFLIQQHGASGVLDRVVSNGRDAWSSLWQSNLRLVVRLARDAALRHGLPLDDLFQEGCLGLADALVRFDFSRGNRLSTLAHEYIQRRVAASAASRCGQLEGPNYRHRVRQRLRLVESNLQRSRQQSVSSHEVARHAGFSLLAAWSAEPCRASLDEVPASVFAVEGGYAEVDRHGTEFLHLLGTDGELLRLRFGIGCRMHTQAEAAEVLGMSASTAARAELRALRRARELLTADICRLPVAA